VSSLRVLSLAAIEVVNAPDQCLLLARLFRSRRAASTEAIECRAAGLPEEVKSFRCPGQTDRRRLGVATVEDDPLSPLSALTGPGRSDAPSHDQGGGIRACKVASVGGGPGLDRGETAVMQVARRPVPTIPHRRLEVGCHGQGTIQSGRMLAPRRPQRLPSHARIE
jgi:hypothetical protein